MDVMKRRKTDNPFPLTAGVSRDSMLRRSSHRARPVLVVAALNLRVDSPLLLGALLAVAVVTSAFKIELPLGRSRSNLVALARR